MHALLRRQLRKAFGDAPRSPELERLLVLVDDAYVTADADRDLLERSMQIMSDELYGQNRRLERELQQRERLEIELRHAEKLRAVGQLAAGVAHEINTPVQFIGDSLTFLDDAFGELERLLVALAALALAGHADVAALLDAHDVPYLREEIPGALDRCRQGTARVATIVRALKALAHPDDVEPQPADLDAAIRNTLVVVANEVKFVADVTVDLAMERQVRCHVGEIQQVLINLLVNAAHAIADRHTDGTRGRITVSLRDEGTRAVIRVSDDGAGIPDAIRHRIFEPFFTTKPVGKGSGQGLSLAHSMIVDHHGGTIEVASKLGVGTTFTVTLPVDGPALAIARTRSR